MGRPLSGFLSTTSSWLICFLNLLEGRRSVLVIAATLFQKCPHWAKVPLPVIFYTYFNMRASLAAG